MFITRIGQSIHTLFSSINATDSAAASSSVITDGGEDS